MRPPFTRLGDLACFAAYQMEFDKLYGQGVTDALGNLVVFDADRCHHVCFKSADAVHNKGEREVWSQERAERIAWIETALKSPNYIRHTPTDAWVYLLEVEADRDNNFSQELYVVFVNAEKRNAPTTVFFLTAFRIDYNKWNEYKKQKSIYDAKPRPPLKPKKKKQK